MRVLGLHIGASYQQPSGSHLNHSFGGSAAALISDGSPIAWTTEGRAGGAFGSVGFPKKAVEFCLATAKAMLADVDAIVVDIAEAVLDHRIMQQRLHDPRRSVSTGRHWLASEFRRIFGVDMYDRLHFCDHSLAHVHGALFGEPESDALGVCFDGAGHSVSGVVTHIVDSDVRVLANFGAEECLFKVYRVVNGLLGLDGSDMHETFSLAPSGNAATYWPLFQNMHQLLPNGGYGLAVESEMLDILNRAELSKIARRGSGEFSQQHRDIAAAGQLVLRKIVGHVLKYYKQITGSRSLYLCGTIAENTEINGRILYAELFERVVVTPVPDDSGNALGAALSVVGGCGSNGRTRKLVADETHDGSTLVQRIEKWKSFVGVKSCKNAIDTAADLLVQGAIVGWVQWGRGFNARATGYRSLLADPRLVENRSRIARVVGAWPETLLCFASVLEDQLVECFDIPPRIEAWPLEAFNLRVRPAMQSLLQAVTSPDGTAVAQCVDKATMPEFHSLIEAFAKATGVPAVCVADICDSRVLGVDSVDAAIGCLLTTDLDYMVIGDCLLEKRSSAWQMPAFVHGLLPTVARGHRLVRGSLHIDSSDFSIESMPRAEFFDPVNSISANAHRVLCLDEPISVKDRCAQLCIEEQEQVNTLAEELLVLWRRGLIAMSPAVSAR